MSWAKTEIGSFQEKSGFFAQNAMSFSLVLKKWPLSTMMLDAEAFASLAPAQ